MKAFFEGLALLVSIAGLFIIYTVMIVAVCSPAIALLAFTAAAIKYAFG